MYQYKPSYLQQHSSNMFFIKKLRIFYKLGKETTNKYAGI